MEEVCYYVVFGEENCRMYETWHINKKEDSLKILKLAYDFAKQQNLKFTTKSEVLHSDKLTKVDKQTLKLALDQYKHYSRDDFHNNL